MQILTVNTWWCFISSSSFYINKCENIANSTFQSLSEDAILVIRMNIRQWTITRRKQVKQAQADRKELGAAWKKDGELMTVIKQVSKQIP